MFKIQFWVARATGLCLPATRRKERERQFEPMGTAFSLRCPRQFRSAGRRPGRAGRPRHPFSKQALSLISLGFREFGFPTVVARPSRPCAGCTIRTGVRPVPAGASSRTPYAGARSITPRLPPSRSVGTTPACHPVKKSWSPQEEALKHTRRHQAKSRRISGPGLQRCRPC